MKNSISINGINYPLTKSILKDMELSGVTRAALRTRILRGWTLHQAVNISMGRNLKDYQQSKAKKKAELDKKSKFYESKKRQDKPYLYDGTPQPPYEGSEYAKHLSENHLIARLKTDSYGMTQLI